MKGSRLLNHLLMLLIVVLTGIALCGCSQLNDTHREYAQRRAQSMILRSNMRNLQLAVMGYFNTHKKYPLQVDDEFKSYFPGGKPGKVATREPFLNPFTGEAQWPKLGTRPNLQALKDGPPPEISPGVVEYNVFDGGLHYAIIGGDSNGKAVTSVEDSKKPLVLSE